MKLHFDAHSDGKVIVTDEPRELPTNARLRVRVEVLPDPVAADAPKRMPPDLNVNEVRAIAEDPKQPWRPLDIQIDPKLSRAIALDPEFDIEES